ncbi:MAG: hypothetical protein MUD17_09090 [Gemmatimonadaceae bacterium]|nr:hypothetical protein [Gemmatimonadaceae bacterium]
MSHSFSRRRDVRALASAALLGVAACAGSTPSTTPAPSPRYTPTTDPRVGLKAGLLDAGEAVSNLKVTAKAVSPEGFLGITNSDLAFTGNYAIQGNYNGPVIWDITNPNQPKLVTAYPCPASQNDVSVYRNLMFMSAEAQNGRTDCMPGGVRETVSPIRMHAQARGQRADVPRVAHAHGARGSEGQGQRLHLRLRLVGHSPEGRARALRRHERR